MNPFWGDLLAFTLSGFAVIVAVLFVAQCIAERPPVVRGPDGRWRAARHKGR